MRELDLTTAATENLAATGVATERPPERHTQSLAGGAPATPRAPGAWLGGGSLPTVDPACYEIGDEIARGGVGRIRAAVDRRLGRTVAIKELHGGGGPAVEARFVREALFTARLQHPAIVSIHEAGRWPSGEPFYAMKRVAGRSLDEVIAERATLTERLALLPHAIAAADAMAYAHSRGVIHRDLKPANVLCGEFGETVVIDWGLAKDLADTTAAPEPVTAAEPAGGLTMAGSIVGTPAYMPPEQAAGEPVDERADVYALGALLYHLLSGRAPYRGHTPRDVVARVQAAPPPSLAAAAPGVPTDLVAVVDKAMARDAAARYPSARELAADLSRFATGQLVGAHHYSAGALLRRWLRRHRGAVAVAAALLAVLAATSVWSVRRIVAEKDQAERERAFAVTQQRAAQAQAAALVLQQARTVIDRDPTSALAWLKRYPADGADRDEVRRLGVEAIGRGVARHVLGGHAGGVSDVAVSPDGRTAASGDQDGAIRLWDVATGGGRLLGRHDGPIVRLVFSPDGARLATTSEDQTTRLWDVRSGASVLLGGCAGAVDLAFLPDGGVAAAVRNEIVECDPATGAPRPVAAFVSAAVHEIDITAGVGMATSNKGELALFDPAGGPLRYLFEGTFTVDAALSADGRRLACAGRDGIVRVMDVGGDDAARVLRGHTGPVTSVGFSPDGALVASVGDDKTARLWDARTGDARGLLAQGTVANGVAFSPDAGLIALGIGSPVVWVWDLATGDARRLGGHRDDVGALAWAGTALVTGSWDGALRVWSPARVQARVLRGQGARVFGMDFAADGGTLLWSDVDGGVRLWDLAGGEVRLVRRCQAMCTAAISPDGARVAVAGAWQGSDLRDRDGRVLGDLGQAVDLAFSPDGASLALADPHGAGHAVRLVDLAAGSERVLGAGEGPVVGVVFSRDGRQLAGLSGEDGAIWWADLPSGRSRRLTGQPAWTLAPGFSTDGRLLASAGSDRSVWLWDTAAGTGRLLARADGAVLAVALDPDGGAVAAAGSEWTIGMWATAGGEARQLLGHGGTVRLLRFSPDGALLASAGDDHTVRLWDVRSGDGATLGRQDDDALALEFSPDGRRLAAGGADGTLRVYPVAMPPAAPHDAAAQRAWLDAASTAEVGPDDEPATPGAKDAGGDKGARHR